MSFNKVKKKKKGVTCSQNIFIYMSKYKSTCAFIVFVYFHVSAYNEFTFY